MAYDFSHPGIPDEAIDKANRYDELEAEVARLRAALTTIREKIAEHWFDLIAEEALKT